MKRCLVFALLLAMFCGGTELAAQADKTADQSQGPSAASATDADAQGRTVGGDVKQALGGVFVDLRLIATSPAHLRAADAEYLVPLAGVAAGLFATDRTTSHEIARNHHRNTAVSFSNAGLATFGAVAGGMYLLGVRNGDDHMRETGLLAAEASADGFVVDEALKYALRRERPFLDNGRGDFFQPGGTSFPSAHATLSFAVASVVAHEYPGWATKTLAYGLATAVSFARVAGQQHFPSDVFIGGAAGYLVGAGVYHRHHQADTENYGTFVRDELPLSAARMSSTYIEMDSWLYAAVERLAAMGVIDTAYLGLRPWTRMSLYAMISDVDDDGLRPQALSLLHAVRVELKRERELEQGGVLNKAIHIDELYERSQYTSGTPLNDSFHFGQTIVDDFGRPFGHGLQQIAGFQARAESGRFSFYVRGEYQHTPSIPGYSAAQNQIIAAQDQVPGEIFAGVHSRDQFRLLDSYASLNILSNEISVGKQTFWWAPDDATALTFSDNAEPIYALRINRTLPLYIPLLSKLIGPIRYDNYFGRIAGTNFPSGPFTYGQKISLHPTKNLELGFSRNAMFAGRGLEPLTFHTFFKSFTSLSSGTTVGFNPRDTPGSRHGGFDFRYRLPGIRDWVTLYADTFAHDDVSPLDAPRRAAVMPGIYLSKFPGLHRLDLHVEGGTTDTVTSRAKGGTFYYWEGLYKDSYTVKRNLIGSWIGREGTGGQAWATWWFSPENTLMLGYRRVLVSQYFIPQGETQQDAYGALNYRWSNGLGVKLLLQDERWVAPVLAVGAQHDFTTRIELSFIPKNWGLRR